MYLSPIIIFLGPWLIGSIATFYFSDYSVIFNNLSITGTWYLSLVGLFLFYSLVIFNIQRRRSLNLENIIKEKLNFNSLSTDKAICCFAFFNSNSFYSLFFRISSLLGHYGRSKNLCRLWYSNHFWFGKFIKGIWDGRLPNFVSLWVKKTKESGNLQFFLFYFYSILFRT